MTGQKTRNNHYVPQCYQHGFLAAGQSRLFHLNLNPDRKTLPDGRQVPRTALHEWGTKNCFVEYDLYTTHFGPIIMLRAALEPRGQWGSARQKILDLYAQGTAAEALVTVGRTP